MNNLTIVQLSDTSHSLYIFGLCGLMLLAMETKGDNLFQPEILNNFVSQLLRTRLDNAISSEGISVSNPRDGWVYFRIEREAGKDASIEVFNRSIWAQPIDEIVAESVRSFDDLREMYE